MPTCCSQGFCLVQCGGHTQMRRHRAKGGGTASAGPAHPPLVLGCILAPDSHLSPLPCTVLRLPLVPGAAQHFPKGDGAAWKHARGGPALTGQRQEPSTRRKTRGRPSTSREPGPQPQGDLHRAPSQLLSVTASARMSLLTGASAKASGAGLTHFRALPSRSAAPGPLDWGFCNHTTSKFHVAP